MPDSAGGRAAVDDAFDAFERFGKAMGAGKFADLYDELVPERPRHVAPFRLGIGEGKEPDAVRVMSYEAVDEVMRDGTRFSSAVYSDVMGQVFGRSIIEMDEPEHRSYRGLLQRAFTRQSLARWEPSVITPAIDAVIDGFAGADRAELVRQFTFPYPLGVIAGLFGLPREQYDTFHRLAVELISVTIDMDAALRASAQLGDLLQPLIDERRARPGDDLVSILAHAEFEGRRLTDREILSFCRLLAPAGVETTYRSTSNILVGLLANPDQLEAVRADRSLVPMAIEEGLRWECPTPAMIRVATCDTEVCGVPIAAGSFVVAHVGAANRDPSRWEDPDRFDVFRPLKVNVASGTGPHVCLVTHLSRMEMTVALNRLFDRVPTMRLDPDCEPPVITGYMFRSPSALPVVFDRD